MTNLDADDRADYFNPGNQNGSAPEDDEFNSSFDYGALFDAPDFAAMMRGRRPAGAKEYETKVKSVLKSAAMAALRTGNIPDAATVLHFGPGFSAAAGDLAAVSDSAKRAIDLITAPDNPYVTFALVAVPFMAQLFRNHEEAFRQLPQARRMAKKMRKEQVAADQKERRNLEIHLPFGRVVRFRIGFRNNPFRRLKVLFHLPTREPQALADQVFSDPKLLTVLERQGIRLVKMQA